MAPAELEQPSQVGREFRYDALPKELQNHLKHEHRRFMRFFEWKGSGGRISLKLYFYAYAEIHLRFRYAHRQGWDFEPHDSCVRFQSPITVINPCDGMPFDLVRRTHNDLIRRRNGQKPTMLVDIGKLPQLPESPGVRVLPSVVRLQPLDACSCATWKALDHVGGATDAALAAIGGPVIEDREFRPLAVPGRVFAGTDDVQPVGQVIKGGAHVIDALPDPHVPFIRYLAHCLHAHPDAPLTITVGPNFNQIRYGAFPNTLFKTVEMLFRPVELGCNGV